MSYAAALSSIHAKRHNSTQRASDIRKSSPTNSPNASPVSFRKASPGNSPLVKRTLLGRSPLVRQTTSAKEDQNSSFTKDDDQPSSDSIVDMKKVSKK